MTGNATTWVAVIVALVSAVGGFATAARTTKPKDREAETATAATLLASYDAFADRLQEEVQTVREDCARRIDRLERQHEAEREEWRKERTELRERVAELEGQVVALMNLPPRNPQARDRRTDD